ncbi:hypothetical protein [Actinomadura litoris]|uniref:DUF8129 domain-containing protein n=1 Tax=Actinomadura litoris TaxID=2678616 RepID=A0A7K1L650_9ACTN|nr:hypothetical protein [Actinomadura litoris]MUN39890.1 hypothetical protein [Actinomadura litoris]
MTRSPRRLKQQVQDTVGEQVRDLPLHAVRLAMFGVGRALLLSDRVTRDYKEITEGGGVRPVLGRLRTDVQGTAERVVGRVVERVRGEEPAPAPRPRPARPSAPSAPSAPRTAPRHAAGGQDGEISIGKPAATPPDTGHTPKHARPAGEPAEPRPAKPEAEKPAAAKPEPAKPEPAKAEPAKPEPTKPEPAKQESEAAKAEPAKAEPAKAEAAESEAAKAGPKDAAELPVPNYDEATLPQLRARLRGLSADQVRLLREYERDHAARTDVIRMYERRIAKLNGHG